jgi:hypothetical protein
VTEQIHPLQVKMPAKRFHVIGDPVDPIGARIGRYLGGARTPVVEQDQCPVGIEPTQLTQVLHGLPWATRDTDQRRTGPDQAIAQFGPIPGAKALHKSRLFHRTLLASVLASRVLAAFALVKR